ncbi:hypothetical protein GCM10010176_092920 [Nonomuraea spiralis]|nr:hypothetical protein GCM10010176_092920 [Nonomuraea spiralis]
MPENARAQRRKRELLLEALCRTRRAKPSHAVDLTGVGADRVADPPTVDPPRGRPAATRAAPGGEASGDRHVPDHTSSRPDPATPPGEGVASGTRPDGLSGAEAAGHGRDV